MAMTTAFHAVWLKLFLHRIGSNRLRVLTRVRLLSNCLFAVLSFVFDHEFLSLANLRLTANLCKELKRAN
jgi:hypothetical protein